MGAIIAAAAGLAMFSPLSAHAQSISGPAEVIDGDTLSMTGTHVRLFGIDAVEAAQTCERGGSAWACGQEAKARLTKLVAGKQVECLGRDTDTYGRLVATCRVGSIDLGEAMVSSGFALAYTQFSLDYADTEARAKQFKLGIWGSAFDPPADWRTAHPERATQLARSSQGSEPAAIKPRVYRDSLGRCAIKGNHSRHGDWIYHLPGQPYYEQTRPEDVFCTEEEAIRAGYRPSRAH